MLHCPACRDHVAIVAGSIITVTRRAPYGPQIDLIFDNFATCVSCPMVFHPSMSGNDQRVLAFTATSQHGRGDS